MENSISAKLNRADGSTNRSFAVQTPGSAVHSANDLFEQFLSLPGPQRIQQRPEPKEPSSDSEPREASTDESHENRVRNKEETTPNTEATAETEEHADSIDPLLVSDSLVTQEQPIAFEQATSESREDSYAGLETVASEHSTVNQPVTETGEGTGQGTAQAESQTGQVVDADTSIGSNNEGPEVIASKQTETASVTQVEQDPSQASDEAAVAALNTEQQASQRDAESPANQSRTSDAQTETSSLQQDAADEQETAPEQDTIEPSNTLTPQGEEDQPDAKWFQQLASNPLYSGLQQTESPISLPPVDSNSQATSQPVEPADALQAETTSLAVDSFQSLATDDIILAEPSGPASNTGNPSESLPSSVVAGRTFAASSATTLSDGNSTAGNQSTNGQPVRPEGSGQVSGNSRAGDSGAPVAESSDISQHERIRLIQRVSRSFSRLTPTGGEINLRLHPPQLGSLAVRVQMEGNSLSARLSTESEAARDIIMESLPVLRKRLADQGIEVTQMHVDVSDGSSDTSLAGSSDHGARDRQGDSGAQRRVAQFRQAVTGRSATPTPIANVSSTPAATQAWIAATSIDVHA